MVMYDSDDDCFGAAEPPLESSFSKGLKWWLHLPIRALNAYHHRNLFMFINLFHSEEQADKSYDKGIDGNLGLLIRDGALHIRTQTHTTNQVRA